MGQFLGPFRVGSATFMVILQGGEIEIQVLRDFAQGWWPLGWETVTRQLTISTPVRLYRADQEEEGSLLIYYYAVDGVVHQTEFYGLQ